MRCLLIGDGDLAHGLARQFHLHHDKDGEEAHLLEVGIAPGQKEGAIPLTFLDTEVPLVNTEEGLCRADAVILAIPSEAYKTFISKYMDYLQHCIVVDVTNPSHDGQDVADVIQTLIKQQTEPFPYQDTHIRWVKAFNDNGALDLMCRKEISSIPFSTTMCSNDKDAAKTFQKFAEEALGFQVNVLMDERYAKIMESSQTKIEEPWLIALWVMLPIFVITEVYAIVRDIVMSSRGSWDQLALAVTNRAFAWTAITGFSLAQWSGMWAKVKIALNKRVRGDMYYTLPNWLISLLECRKHVALLSFFFVGMHAIVSLVIFSDAYFSWFYQDNGKLTAKVEWSMLAGALSFGIYTVLSVASLPDVGKAMSFAQWHLCFGPVVWCALALGLIHNLALGASDYWTMQERWPAGMPSVALMSSIIPMLTVVLKICQEFFLLAIYYGCCTTSYK